MLNQYINDVNERKATLEEKNAARMIRRWRKNHPLSVANCLNPLTGAQEKRVLVDGKMVLRLSEISSATKQAFEESKGAGSRKIRHRLKSVFSGVTHRKVQTSLKSLPEKQSVNPIFDNVVPLKPIRATSIQERHQIDLVDMSRHTEFYNGVEYKYILSVLDVFSRYVWLRPLNSKESTEIADALESIYESEGPPKIIQCDNGREFHGSVTRLTENLIPGKTQADICINEVNFHNVNTVCIPNRDLNSNQNNTDNNNVHSNDFSHYSLQEVQLEPQLTDYSSDSILHLHLSTNDSSLSPPVSHVNIGPSASFPDNELFQTANDHIDSPVPPALETPTLQRFSPTAISDTNNLSSTEKDRLFPPSLNSSFYLSPPSLSPITDRINDSNLDKQPPVLSPVRLRSNVRPPKKFTPSDYVRARKQIFPETENVNQKQFTDLPYFIQRHILSFVIYKNFNMFLTLIRVSTHFKHLLGTLHKLCPKVYLNENVMFLLEGRSVFAEGVRHNWSVRQLGRVSGSGSGVMMELRNILRPISSRWINGYIEILATAIAGWYYIVDFKFKK
ncbi:uncharacterized protein LOC134275091 [Saccostrea cucullata]|uniref:uncharacterized protein LOC134275091 n=1 Tax=Saccostrea cuccullata TaxID=36930 RepID=UPI002ED18B2C